jgi:hypothetical protein
MVTGDPGFGAALQDAVAQALDKATQDALGYAQTFPVGSSPDIQARWIEGFDTFSWQFVQLYSRADWLQAQGLPVCRQRLDAVWADWTTARQKYLEAWQATVGAYAQMARIWQGAIDYTTDALARTNASSQRVFDGCMQQYFDVTENRCFDCHTSIGVPGGGYCLTCARRRGLIS